MGDVWFFTRDEGLVCRYGCMVALVLAFLLGQASRFGNLREGEHTDREGNEVALGHSCRGTPLLEALLGSVALASYKLWGKTHRQASIVVW